MTIFKILVTGLFLFTSGNALAGEGRSRLTGTVAGGLVQYSIVNPAPEIKFNNATEFNLQAEKPFGDSPIYLIVSLNYLKGSGTLNYNYLGSVNYASQNIPFSFDDYRVDMGLRLKFFDNHAIRPYLEAGGLGNYKQISYDNSLRNAVGSLGSDYRTIEGVIEFGYYGEGGIELQLAQSWGLRLAYHYLNSTTRGILTLRNQTVNYIGNIYYGGLFWNL